MCRLFVPGMRRWLNVQNPVHVTHHVNWLKKNNRTITPITAEKALDKIQHPNDGSQRYIHILVPRTCQC